MTVDVALCIGAVVVGDDGSADAAHAVKWAYDDALRRGVQLVVLRAWTVTSAPRPSSFEAGYVPSEDEFAEAVRQELEADVRTTLGADASVTLLPAHDTAKSALVAATQTAALVVVAARGRGLARALLGSTTEHIVKRAQGPITVIPHRRE